MDVSFSRFFTLKLIAIISCVAHLIKMFWSPRMKMILHAQQMKVKSLRSPLGTKTAAQKEGPLLKT